jgi:hypothetical protein
MKVADKPTWGASGSGPSDTVPLTPPGAQTTGGKTVRTRTRWAAAATSLGLVTMAMGATNVLADPTGPPTPPLLGVTTADT